MPIFRLLPVLLLAALLAGLPALASAEAYAKTVARDFTNGCLGENPGRTAYCTCALHEAERSMPESEFVVDSRANAKFEASEKLSDQEIQRIALLREMMRSAAKSCAARAR